MEITIDKATTSKTKATKMALVEPVSDLNNDTNITITGMEPEFHKAAMQGNINAFQGMGAHIESIITPNKNTILHIHFTNYTDSVSEKFVEEVLGTCPALLLKTNVKDETILHIAAKYGHHEIVKQLIDYAKVLPKDINEVGVEKKLMRAINDKKDTAFHEAARYGHEEVVDILIKEELDHSYFGQNVDGETPLHIAVERQYWDVVDTILDNSNSPQYNGPNGRTALHAAVLHGDNEKVSKLLSRNLSATKQSDENGWVPLHLAALCATSDVVEVLLRNDRSTTYMRDKKGRTALHFAALREDSSVIEKIIEYCPDCCELVDEKGFNVFHYTTMGERKLFFELKHIMQDAPIISNLYNEKDDEGNTPLHLLARHAPKPKDYVCHPLLGERNPRMDIMACNKYGQTVLDVAVADIPPGLVEKNAMLNELQDIGARLGGRVPDKHPRENKQEKRHDLAVDKREEQYKTYNQDDLAGVATSLSVVAILIATVTFAAVFTLPGGLIQDKGSPTLKYNAAFITFVKTDSLSFVLSASSVLALFFSSIIRREEHMYELLLVKCAFLSMVAMGFMVIAFGMGVYTVLGVSKGFGIITLLIVLSFLFVFIILLWRTCVFITRRRQSAYDGPYYRQIYDVETPRNIQLSHTL